MNSSGLSIDMLVLDALQDDLEQLPSIMRMLGEWRQRLKSQYTTDDVLAALRRLIEADLVAVLEESLEIPELVPVGSPDLSPDSLRRYWYEPTSEGRTRWEAWDKQLESQ